jgi:hypothetical protein
MMENNEGPKGLESLCEIGFTPSQAERLDRFYRVYIERKQQQSWWNNVAWNLLVAW